jgi:hypothetical protein
VIGFFDVIGLDYVHESVTMEMLLERSSNVYRREEEEEEEEEEEGYVEEEEERVETRHPFEVQVGTVITFFFFFSIQVALYYG